VHNKLQQEATRKVTWLNVLVTYTILNIRNVNEAKIYVIMYNEKNNNDGWAIGRTSSL